MTTRKTKPQTPTPPAAPYIPSDYERGVLDVLDILKEEVYRMGDAARTADRLLWEQHPAVRSLLSFASPAVNIAGDVENRVIKRAMAKMDEARTTPAASPR